jgi:hypothetical protein
MAIFPYKHSQAGQPSHPGISSKIPPQAIFYLLSKQYQNNKRDIHPAHLFPYKQALSYLKHCDLLGRCLMYLVIFDDQLKLLNISLNKGCMIVLFTG